MRVLMMALAAFALAACDGTVNVAGDEGSSNPAGGYTLEVRALDDIQVFVVTAPDGRSAAGRAAEGVSALMDAEEAQALTMLPAMEGEPPEVLALRVPGFDLSIRAEGDSSGEEGARVSINAAGRQVQVNARDDGAGGNEHAHVRITGACEQDARDFIAKGDELSPAVQADMLTALGLD
jgi:hypothetical protein